MANLPSNLTLPPHAAEVMTLFGFPYGADNWDAMWWRTQPDGTITLYAVCNDTFWWATADNEEILPADLPALRQCLEDLRQTDEEYLLADLFAARKRGMRPQKPYLYGYGRGDKRHDGVPNPETLVLFEACGPERDQ